MDIEKEYSCLEQNKKVIQKNIEIDENYQETLQAYCDDLYRIIKCSAHSYVTSISINYNEIKIFGKTEICVTYYDEASNLCYADFDEEFTKSIESDNLSDSAFANAVACDKYCSFRVINQRRIDVHCSCCVNVSVYDKYNCPCISSCKTSKLRYEKIKTADIIGASINRLEFDEEVTINNSSVKRIISASGYANVIETKIIKDKALVKVNASICVLYVTDDDNSPLKYEHSFSASKIIDLNGISEDAMPVVSVDIGSLYFKLKSSSSDSSCVIQLYGDVSVNSVFVIETEKVIVTDGYVLKRNSSCEYSSYPCLCDGNYINEDMLHNISFDYNNEINKIYDLSVSFSEVSIKNSKVYSKINSVVICKNEQGDLASYSSSIDVELFSSVYEMGIVCLSQKSIDYSIKANGKIDVRLACNLTGYFYNEKNCKVLSEISAEDSSIEYPALTVYFGKKDEAIWNIAKSFSSDMNLIIKENELSSEILDANKVLIIPGV